MKRKSQSKITIMISSRCNDKITYKNKSHTYTDLRLDIQKELEDFEIFGKKIFNVYLNETEPPEGSNAWDQCLDKVKECDFFIALVNGNSGWNGNTKGIGICHAELMTAVNYFNEKVRLVQIKDPKNKIKTDKKFSSYIKEQHLDTSMVAKNGEEVIAHIKTLVSEMLVSIVQLTTKTKKSKYDTGSTLLWSKLNFEERSFKIKTSLEKFLKIKGSAISQGITLEINGIKCLLIVHGMPGSMSSSISREMVGRPFLKDHLLFKGKKKTLGQGPIHIIGCHRNASEGQALKILGYEDSIAISADFGVFVYDPVYNVQLVFISNCRDDSLTSHGIKRFFDWLERASEHDALVKRAIVRKKILSTIATET